MYKNLFSPVSINKLTLTSRAMMSLYPTKYVEDGKPTRRLVEFFVARARGGVGLIVLDPACPDYPDVYKGSVELRMDTPEHRAALREMVRSIQVAGAKVFMQLTYSAYVPSSADELGAKQKKGRWVRSLLSAEPEYLLRVALKLAAAAATAQEIGYDGVELQASYGGLLASLLSPLANKRSDAYGGSLENRARLLLEVIASVREKTGRDFPLSVKFTAAEGVPGGFDLDESTVVARWLEAVGVDAILVDVGNKKNKARLVPPHALPPGVNVPQAAAIKKAVAIPVIAMGKINTPELAESILSSGAADMVSMARAFIADPEFLAKAKDGRPQDIRGCIYCLDDCADKGIPGLGRACAVNPYAGQETTLVITPAEVKKKVLIIGGGPAGMEGALVAAARGHAVTLVERDDVLGGQFRLAELAPYKQEVKELIRYLETRLAKSSVNVETGIYMEARDIASGDWDVLVLATGSVPRSLEVKGVEQRHVLELRDYLDIMPPVGRDVVIIGGGQAGCELAEMIAPKAQSITILEASAQVLAKLNSLPKEELLGRLAGAGVKIVTEVEVLAIEQASVSATHDGQAVSFPADQVIYSIGSEPNQELVEAARFISAGHAGKPEVVVVGDAMEVGSVGYALRGAVEKLRNCC